MADALPLIAAVVELDGLEEIRLVGDVVDAEPEDVEVGAAVAVDWYDVRDGDTVPVFRVAGDMTRAGRSSRRRSTASPRRRQNPNIPISPEEIAADALACIEAGAAIVHNHIDRFDGCRATRQPSATWRAGGRCLAERPDALLYPTTNAGPDGRGELRPHRAAGRGGRAAHQPGRPGSVNFGGLRRRPGARRRLRVPATASTTCTTCSSCATATSSGPAWRCSSPASCGPSSPGTRPAACPPGRW